MQELVRHDDIQEKVVDLLKDSYPSTLSIRLRELSRALLAESYSREELIQSYGQLALNLADEEDREAEEEELLEVIADLEGATSSPLRI